VCRLAGILQRSPALEIFVAKNRYVSFGYKLSSEEFPASDLVRLARAAEEHGFEFALISHHFHPWTSRG